MYDKSGRASDADIKRLTESLNQIPDRRKRLNEWLANPGSNTVFHFGKLILTADSEDDQGYDLTILKRRRKAKSERIHTRRVK